jgi:DNA modification methylase/superfamily II DNA or RNA helicase
MAATKGERVQNYEDFVAGKRRAEVGTGHQPGELNPHLFDFQHAIVSWAVRRGRAAIFADTGLGKTAMQTAWADEVCRHTQGRVLIVAPLCVAHQTVKEAAKFGISVQYCRAQTEATGGIIITNYEMLDRFDVSSFSGVVLDESSILKSYMGKTKRALLESCAGVPYRLACTATPSPNDYLELGNHAEFLGIMPSNEMIMRFFQNDTMEAGAYVLRPHAATKFWEWCATWSVCLSNPADLGYDGRAYVLPALNQSFVEVSTEGLPAAEGELFRTVTINATSVHKEGRLTVDRRAAEVAKLVNDSDEPWLVWCNTNYEADALKGLIPDAVDLRGSDSIDKKEKSLDGFVDGSIRVLITKPSIAGMGLNLQHCRNMAFVGLSYSYEDYYQAIRRCYRFGQKREVNCYVMAADSERSILAIIQDKEQKHNVMKAEMVRAISNFYKHEHAMNEAPYFGQQTGDDWTVHHGDCVHVARKIEADSIGFSVYSPPFSNLYIYSDSDYDMGNSTDDGEFMRHYAFLAEELHRITKPGRLTAIHCKDLPMYKGRDGAAGLRDFPGEIIKMYESKGWQYHSRVTIWKDPVIEMQRTKNHGLLYKQLCKDSAASRQGMADYIIVMRKWADEEKWEPVTRGKERFFDYIGSSYNAPQSKDWGRARSEEERQRLYSISVWQRYASPVWFDIDQTDVLNYKLAKEKDEERHICPLQLDVIERCVELWSNPGDLVFSPFTGIGSEGYVSLKMGRKFVGAELKKSYFDIACCNLAEAARADDQIGLFA